jgi:biotin-dependent carboxylase-like uncharacterized protein
MKPVLKVLHPGAGCSLQDPGRPGWKRYGVPAGGAMDRESAGWANRLVGNPEEAPVLELALTGARLQVLREAELALTGADVDGSHPRWRSFFVRAGEEIQFRGMRGGVWSYLAVAGGFVGPRWFGSVSVNARAGFGSACGPGTELVAGEASRLSAVASRYVREAERPRFSPEMEVPVWPGPEWEVLDPASAAQFLSGPWNISPHGDRTGYRLDGPLLDISPRSMLSAPLAVGTIQLPPGGRPLVILRDGPTVGGYPRLAIVDPSALSRFTQCAPGSTVRFRLLT